jgi:hypothetical protein
MTTAEKVAIVWLGIIIINQVLAYLYDLPFYEQTMIFYTGMILVFVAVIFFKMEERDD